MSFMGIGFIVISIFFVIVIFSFWGIDRDLEHLRRRGWMREDRIDEVEKKLQHVFWEEEKIKNKLQHVFEEVETIGEYCRIDNNMFIWKKFKREDLHERVGGFVKIRDKWIPEGLVIEYSRELIGPIKADIVKIAIRSIEKLSKEKEEGRVVRE